MGVKHHLQFLLHYFKIELAALIEYKSNFFLQSIGMFVNDLFWILFWWLFMQRFQDLNGWGFNEVAVLWAVVTTSFGLQSGFFNHASRIARHIEDGTLDYYLPLPKNVLVHVISKVSYPALGDLLFGTVLAVLFVPAGRALIFVATTLLSTIILISFAVLVNSLGFWFERFKESAYAIRDCMMILSNYPLSIFGGFTKFFIIFLFPAGMAGGVPVELIRNFSWTWLGYMVGVTMAFSMLAVGLFYLGLKRYESGNTMILRD